MSILDKFWEYVEAQLEELKSAKTADDVIRILASPGCTGDAFFGGGGGDETVWDSLYEAGWKRVWAEADYYWCFEAPDGSMITYVEGDVYRGNSRAEQG
ncbi:hypothetical protein ACIGXM_14565 [Kitasatospora sp. NPDC052896]|uniref:hypothetical protein n=1 Tax=Kitasatospora sp. NPDC052896 TaxID=3364061 RepID=UPI0037C9EBC5